MSKISKVATLATLAAIVAAPAFAAQPARHNQRATAPGTQAYVVAPNSTVSQTPPWVNEEVGPGGDRQLVRPY